MLIVTIALGKLVLMGCALLGAAYLLTCTRINHWL
jgi:hypothetical protein